MISFRHHIVSLVAVFLALAVGVVLGSGPLDELARDDRPTAAVTTEDAPATEGFGDRFAAASAARLYAGGLAEHTVSIVVMPGADGDVVAALADQVAAAGGRVAGTYSARASLTDAGQKALVDTLGSQVAEHIPAAADAGASTYVRMGQLLATAAAFGDVPSADVIAVRESLAGADLVDSPAEAKTGELVLVVLGDPADPAIVAGLATGLAGKATVVVAGDADELSAVRADASAERVTTVDGADTALGRVTATLALIRSLTTQGGSFGASGSDGAVPLQ